MKRNILGHRKDYWGPLEALEQVAPDSSEIVKSVQNLPNIRYVHTLKCFFFLSDEHELKNTALSESKV